MQNALLIFIKNPIRGKVKTRLAADAGEEQALRIYKSLLKRTREASLQVEGTRYLYYSHFMDKNDDWSETSFHKRLQSGDSLGERMYLALEACLQKHVKAVLIGSDIANLKPEIIQDAFDALDKIDVVLGPTYDGGYYLIGMRKPHANLFENIAWSTPDVLAQTKQQASKSSVAVELLPTLSDIDYLSDWERYGWPLDEPMG